MENRKRLRTQSKTGEKMSKALCWIRKSKGDENSVGLEIQREKVKQKADQLTEQKEILDLGIHTGFSIHNKEPGQERLDNHPEVIEQLNKLESGEYDYLVAYDDTRICRDEYFATIKHKCVVGRCEIVYVADVTEDELAFKVTRDVETHVKKKEIQKSKEAVKKRISEGHYHGRPPFGYRYDESGKSLEPGEDFQTALDIIEARKNGKTYGVISEELGVPKATAHRVVERQEQYLGDLELFNQ